MRSTFLALVLLLMVAAFLPACAVGRSNVVTVTTPDPMAGGSVTAPTSAAAVK